MSRGERSVRGTIGKTIANSEPWWPPCAEAAGRRAQRSGRAVRRCRLLRFRLLRLADQDADHRRARGRGPALHRLPHHRDVLDHARGAVDRAQPPFGRRRLPRQFRQRLSRLSRQDRARGRHAGRDAAAARLPQLHGRQMARHAADRKRRRPDRSTAGRSAAASTASTASSTPRPTSTRRSWSRDNTHIDPPGTYAERLSPDRGPGRPGDPLHRRPHRRPRRICRG